MSFFVTVLLMAWMLVTLYDLVHAIFTGVSVRHLLLQVSVTTMLCLVFYGVGMFFSFLLHA
jgi:hypothetical protein